MHHVFLFNELIIWYPKSVALPRGVDVFLTGPHRDVSSPRSLKSEDFAPWSAQLCASARRGWTTCTMLTVRI